MKFGQTLLLSAAILLGAANGCHAESIHLGEDKVSFAWIGISGQARDISINGDGDVAVIDPNGQVWQWGKIFENTWAPLGGEFERITVSPAGNPWAINKKGKLFRYNSNWWEQLPVAAIDIASSGSKDKSHFAIIDPKGAPLLWDEIAQKWQPFQTKGAQPPPAVRIALDAKGAPWIISSEGNIWQLLNQEWALVPGSASDIAIGPGGDAYITTPERAMQRWDPKRRLWITIDGVDQAMTVAVGPSDKPWYVLADGSILASDLFQEKLKTKESTTKAPAARNPGSTATFTSTEPIEFVKVSGYAYQLAIGSDGSVFVSGPDGQLLRWSSLNKAFVEFPGTLSRIAVDPNGNPWGLGGGMIYRFDGSRWTIVPGSATEIAIGHDGTVMITDADDRVYRYNPEQNRFLKLPDWIKGTKIAVDPQGNPWTIHQDHSIFRCTQESCMKTPLKGSSIAIGPDNSVYMTDADKHLYRWDAANLTWQRFSTPISTSSVAVGPSGRPWVIDKNGAIYASRFFLRDESSDTAETTTAGYKSSRSPVSTFTFTKAMTFQKVPLPIGASALTIAVGADGGVYVQSLPFPGALYRYNPQTKRLGYNPIQPTGSINFWTTAETNGRLWHYNSSSSMCIRQTAPNTNSWNAPYLEGGASQNICYHFAVGANNSVFAVINKTGDPPGIHSLYRYDDAKGVFVLFSNEFVFAKVAVDPNGNPWVITNDKKIWRHDGKKFLPLPGGGKPQKQDVKWVAIGPGGAAYITDIGDNLFKWNETGKSFDRVNRTNVGSVATDAQGKPWIIDTSAFPRRVFMAR